MISNANFFLIVFCLLILNRVQCAYNNDETNIGIIGCGIGSASFVYYMQKFLIKNEKSKNKRIHIDIYEQESKVGGRLQSTKFQNQTVEIGASHFYDNDYLLNEFLINTNMDVKYVFDDHHKKYAIFDELNSKMILNGFKHFSLTDYMFNYGIYKYYTFSKLLQNFLTKFNKIYKYLNDDDYYFNSLNDLLIKIGLYNETQIDCYTYLYRKIISDDKYIISSLLLDEYLTSLLRLTHHNNIHSLLNINAFDCLYSLSKLFYKNYIWYLKDGNEKLAQTLLDNIIMINDDNKEIEINLYLKHKITKIQKINNKKYKLNYQILNKQQIPKNIQDLISSKIYDYVIIATPIELSGLQLKGFAQNEYENIVKDFNLDSHIDYINTYITFVPNDEMYNLDEAYFHLSNEYLNSKTNLNEIFIGNKENVEPIFNYMDIHYKQTNIYKIYSTHPLTLGHFSKLFKYQKDKHAKRYSIKSYPRYTYKHKTDIFSPIRLHKENIFYINSIESISTSAELSVIAAKNIAKMIRSTT